MSQIIQAPILGARASAHDASPRRRIVIHDYAGYPFAMQLSRWLAGRGHTVLHTYSKDVEAPRGRLTREPNDPPGLSIEGVSTATPLAKYQLLRRWFQELCYGSELGRRVLAFRPDIVLSANSPPAVQSRLLRATSRANVPLLCWVQDLFSLGAANILRSKPAPLRWATLQFLDWVEFGTMRRSAGVIVITDDFLPQLAAKGVRHPLSVSIENWAPIEDISPLPKDTPWSRAHGLADKFVFLYAGTIGLKHNPVHLANLARAFQSDAEVRIVAVSQGPGRAYLEAAKVKDHLDNLLLLDYQPFEKLSDVLSCADVSVLLLENFADSLSVPSKVYSYFCSERPILGAIPATNLACRIVERERAGICIAPEDESGFIAAANRLRCDSALRQAMVANQRPYALRAFDIDHIGARFSAVIDQVFLTRNR